MVKNILIPSLLALLIISLFYAIDRATNNGNGLIFFSFLSISSLYLFSISGFILTFMYMIKRYYNQFLSIFIAIFLVLNMIISYLTSFEFSLVTLKLFLRSTEVILGGLSFISLLFMIFYCYKRTK